MFFLKGKKHCPGCLVFVVIIPCLSATYGLVISSENFPPKRKSSSKVSRNSSLIEKNLIVRWSRMDLKTCDACLQLTPSFDMVQLLLNIGFIFQGFSLCNQMKTIIEKITMSTRNFYAYRALSILHKTYSCS